MKDHVLRVPGDLWELIVAQSEEIPGLNATTLAREYLRNGVLGQKPTKTKGAAKEKIKKESIEENENNFYSDDPVYFYPNNVGELWITNNEDLEGFFYFCDELAAHFGKDRIYPIRDCLKFTEEEMNVGLSDAQLAVAQGNAKELKELQEQMWKEKDDNNMRTAADSCKVEVLDDQDRDNQ